jgi:hypothetical protein
MRVAFRYAWQMRQASVAAKRRTIEALPLVVLVLSVAIAYWPAVSADWIRDDYWNLAVARMVGNPWALFVTDHFHAPGSHFRPLAYFAYWATQAMFGAGHMAQALVEGVIHLAVTILLYGLMRRVAGIGPSLVTALLFGVHPAVVTTAAWYADRGGHLALLFILAAMLVASLDRWPFGKRVALSLALALAAMLSKETGLIIVPALAIIGWSSPEWRDRRHVLIAALIGIALVFLAWRAWILGTVLSNTLAGIPLTTIMIDGLGKWLAQFGAYASIWPKLSVAAKVSIVAFVSPAIVLAWYFNRVADRKGAAPWAMLGAACVLIVGPGILQAPVAAQNALPLTRDMSWVEFAMQARLYYVTAAGIAIVAAIALDRIWSVPRHAGRRVLLTTSSAVCVVAIMAGWHAVDGYRERSIAIGALAREATAAVAASRLPMGRCKIAFQGIEPPPEWDVYVSMDEVVKALSPDVSAVSRCLITDNYGTFVYLLPPHDAEAFARLIPSRSGTSGEPLPVRRVGDLALAYFPIIPTPAMQDGALRLRWHDGSFSHDRTAQ